MVGGICEDKCGTNGYCCNENDNNCPSAAQQAAYYTSYVCVKRGKNYYLCILLLLSLGLEAESQPRHYACFSL